MGRDAPHPGECPHGCGDFMYPVNGDPLEPADPYCPECGHIKGNGCGDGCYFETDEGPIGWRERAVRMVRMVIGDG